MLNLAIIGCGRISYKHVQAAVKNCASVKLTAVCDVIKDRAEKRAEEYAALMDEAGALPAVYEDYRKMLEAGELDLVAICTESGFHADISIYCMNRGKHVIVEKPMALSIADADMMIESAKTKDVKLCVSHQNRFNLPIQKLRKAIEDGRFGKIISGNARVLWNRGAEYYDQAPWRGTYEQDGGCLMNQCIHNIDLLQWMLGEEVGWIHAEVGNFIHPYIEAEDYGSIQMKFKNGAIGNVEGTVCVYPSNLEETLSIIGEKGTAVIGGLAVNKIQTWKFEDGDEAEKLVMAECNREIDSVYGEGHSALYADMISAIENKREPYINGETGKKAMEIILAAYKSSEEGKRINFPIENVRSTDFKKENQI